MFGVIFAQSVDFKAGRLDSDGANGGPAALLAQPFYFGINGGPTDPVTGLPPNPNVFNIYDGWSKYAGLGNDGSPQAARGAIYRGQVVFNTAGHCGGCHNTPNVGGHSTPVFFNTGTAEPPNCGSDLPLLTLQNKVRGHQALLRSGPCAVHWSVGGHRKVSRAAAAWSGLSRAIFPRRASRDDQRRHPALPGSLQPRSDDPADQRSGCVPERALRRPRRGRLEPFEGSQLERSPDTARQGGAVAGRHACLRNPRSTTTPVSKILSSRCRWCPDLRGESG